MPYNYDLLLLKVWNLDFRSEPLVEIYSKFMSIQNDDQRIFTAVRLKHGKTSGIMSSAKKNLNYWSHSLVASVQIISLKINTRYFCIHLFGIFLANWCSGWNERQNIFNMEKHHQKKWNALNFEGNFIHSMNLNINKMRSPIQFGRKWIDCITDEHTFGHIV